MSEAPGIIKVCKVHGVLTEEQVRRFKNRKRCIQCIRINDMAYYFRHKEKAVASRKAWKKAYQEIKALKATKRLALRRQSMNLTWESPEAKSKLEKRIIHNRLKRRVYYGDKEEQEWQEILVIKRLLADFKRLCRNKNICATSPNYAGI